jgi:hypothetical protein
MPIQQIPFVRIMFQHAGSWLAGTWGARRVCLPIASSLAAFALAASVPAAAHDSWINRGAYVSPVDGVRCCGDHDCFEIEASQIRTTGSGYLLNSGEAVPFKETLVSEDGKFWRCQRHDGSRRCFFAPPSGS